MSNSVSLDLVALALKEAKLPPAQTREILESLNTKAAEIEATKEPKAPRAKTQFVLVQTEPSTAWVVSIPEADGPHTVVDRMVQAAHAFNATKKGRLLPVKTLSEAFENLKPKVYKEADISKIHTRLPVAVIKTVNKLPAPPTI